MDISAAALEVEALGLTIGGQGLQRIVISLLILLSLLLLRRRTVGVASRKIDQWLQQLIGIITTTIVALA